jgi:predicted DNA-binding protein YlxM (UPF0122 family)
MTVNNFWKSLEVSFKEEIHGKAISFNSSQLSMNPEYWDLKDKLVDLQAELYKRVDMLTRTICTAKQMKRFNMYFLDQLTYQQIADKEMISVISVYYSLCGRKGFGLTKKNFHIGAIDKVKNACQEDTVCKQIINDIRDISNKLAEMENV